MAIPFLPTAKDAYTRANVRYPSAMRIVRFAISGGIATSVNLSTLFILTHYIGVWYLYSSVVAYAVSFFVSFTLQKFWTFGNTSVEHLHTQVSIFLSIFLVGLALNTTLIHFFVEYMHTHYLLGQLVSILFIAVINFLTYKHFVFRDRSSSSPQS